MHLSAGLADRSTYTGNLDLDSEVAAEVEIGLDFDGKRADVSPRLFDRDVEDYIQGGASSNTAAVMFVRAMNMMNGPSAPDPLEFQNVGAEFYGFDMHWGVALSERWSVSGVLNYIRGTTSDDNAYRIPPLNGLVALNYIAPRWGVDVESFFAAEQSKVCACRGMVGISLPGWTSRSDLNEGQSSEQPFR